MDAKLGEGATGPALRRARRSAGGQRRRHPWRRWVAAGVAVVVLAIAVDLPLAYAGSANLGRAADRAQALLNRYQREGVPAATIEPLRVELAGARAQPWFSPTFWLQPRQATVSAAQQAARAAFAAALRAHRAKARTQLEDYQRFVTQNSAWLGAPETTASAASAKQLARAKTPAQLATLSQTWKGKLAAAEKAAQGAEAGDAALVSLSAGPTDLTGQATEVLSLAQAAGLSPLQLPGALTSLRQATAAGHSTSAASARLAAQVEAVRAEVGLQQQLEGVRETVMGLVDQGSVERVTGAATFQAQYLAAKSELGQAKTVSQLASVAGSFRTLQGKVSGVLEAQGCGHSALTGKSIYISLSFEEMVFYDNGCAVKATPVTTGRPGETTPTGTFSVFVKASPLEFVSGYAPGSPNYYTPFLASYAMEFLSGGYYIHNAPWEPLSAFGPGSQDDLADASHGCVHTPISTLAWAYAWTPYGTPVVISA
ncbi:MAG TPA: L,D-transpeptidase [Candidatus Dormibacteraeota bacterium]